MAFFGLGSTEREEAIKLAVEEERKNRLLKESPKLRQLAIGRELLKQKRTKELRNVQQQSFQFGRNIAAFQPPQEDFSFQEQVLRETFGRGEHIWGSNMQPVELNNDLNPRQRGDFGTSELFGF